MCIADSLLRLASITAALHRNLGTTVQGPLADGTPSVCEAIDRHQIRNTVQEAAMNAVQPVYTGLIHFVSARIHPGRGRQLPSIAGSAEASRRELMERQRESKLNEAEAAKLDGFVHLSTSSVWRKQKLNSPDSRSLRIFQESSAPKGCGERASDVSTACSTRVMRRLLRRSITSSPRSCLEEARLVTRSAVLGRRTRAVTSPIRVQCRRHLAGNDRSLWSIIYARVDGDLF
jgi:hypothetical protein